MFRPAGSRSVATNGIHTRRLGRKEYELTDHLGNVRAVIGDYRQSEGGGIRAALKAYFNHYAFGLEMPGMVWKGGAGYRYGYNGKEIDADFQNNYDYGFRIYDEASCRFLSVDPLASSYPWYTPYQFAGNKPVKFIDLDGLEEAPHGKDAGGINAYKISKIEYDDSDFDGDTPASDVSGRDWKTAVNAFANVWNDAVSLADAAAHPARTWNNIKKTYETVKTSVGSAKNYLANTSAEKIQRDAHAILTTAHKVDPNTADRALALGISVGIGMSLKYPAGAMAETGAPAATPALTSPWTLNPFARGREIERLFGANIPVSNFPTIDNFLNGIATSIKSVDLRLASYQNAATLENKLTGYVDKMAAYTGQSTSWGGITIAPGQISGRALQVAIPQGSATVTQQQVMNRIINYGASRANPVTVTFTPVQ